MDDSSNTQVFSLDKMFILPCKGGSHVRGGKEKIVWSDVEETSEEKEEECGRLEVQKKS